MTYEEFKKAWVWAVGTLLCNLTHICVHTTPGTGQIWRLRVSQKNAEPVHDYLDAIATKSRTSVAAIVRANKLASSELSPHKR